MAVVAKSVEDVKILIVDDLSFMRDVIRDILLEAGFTVAGEAENGWDGYKKYLQTGPDVVLMDITMPVMDGLRSLKKIRKKDPRAVIIMCSALGQQEYIIKAIHWGARDFVVKPFKPERIVSAVKKAAGLDDRQFSQT